MTLFEEAGLFDQADLGEKDIEAAHHIDADCVFTGAAEGDADRSGVNADLRGMIQLLAGGNTRH